GITSLGDGRFVVSSTKKHKSLSVFSANGEFECVIGSGIVSKSIGGLYFDINRNLLFVADCGKHQIHIFSNVNGKWMLIRSIGSRGIANGQFNVPYDVAVINNEFVVSDIDNHRLQFFDITTGIFIRSVGSLGNGPNKFDSPSGMFFDASSNSLYVCDLCNSRICVLTSNGLFKRSFSSEDNQLDPCDVCVSDDGQFVVVSDRMNYCIQVFRNDGSFVTSYGSRGNGNGQLSYPCDICLNNEGDLLICDNGNNRVVRIHAIN
ncbi:MAG: 6-bladed beta-propeller, partial [Oscillospiraceae bacterium]